MPQNTEKYNIPAVAIFSHLHCCSPVPVYFHLEYSKLKTKSRKNDY